MHISIPISFFVFLLYQCGLPVSAAGDQLNLEITLQPLPSPQLTNQLTRTPSILVGHVVGPGVEVIRDLGTAPTLDLTEVEVTMFDHLHLVSSRDVRVVLVGIKLIAVVS